MQPDTAVCKLADSQTVAGEPPASAVSLSTGLCGLAGLVVAFGAIGYFKVPVFTAALIALTAAFIPMLLWTLLVEKVWKNASTGLDFSRPRPQGETLETTRVKLVALFATWAIIAFLYFILANYTFKQFGFYFLLLSNFAIPAAAFAFVYVYYVDMHMLDPKDSLWHFGALIAGRRDEADMEKVMDHVRAWAVKGFFLAFMVPIVPGNMSTFTNFDWNTAAASPVGWFLLAIGVLYSVDVIFGTIGYIATFRLLDSHIRRANPHMDAWLFALICYPPFSSGVLGGPLNYGVGGDSWHQWLKDYPVALAICGVALVSLTAMYASATMIFGLRFSNLTDRGIITNGPYRYFKHPAYLSKNLSWWLMYMPFLSKIDATSALRSCMLLLAINFIYYMRAKTEEKQLMADPAYRAYSEWIAEHGLLEKAWRKIRQKVDRRAPAMQAAE